MVGHVLERVDIDGRLNFARTDYGMAGVTSGGDRKQYPLIVRFTVLLG